MPKELEDILSHRSDLSNFLVHMTKDDDFDEAEDCLKQILKDWKLLARSPYGQAVAPLKKAKKKRKDQNVVCFSEAPIEHIKHIIGPIRGRGTPLEPYGIVITKRQARKKGANPIWYLECTPRGVDWLTKPINKLIKHALDNPSDTILQNIFKITPYIEQMGDWGTTKKEFWWEREWRFVGDFELPSRILVLCPENKFGAMRRFLRSIDRIENVRLIDPTWGMSRIIARLAGFSPEDSQPY